MELSIASKLRYSELDVWCDVTEKFNLARMEQRSGMELEYSGDIMVGH